MREVSFGRWVLIFLIFSTNPLLGQEGRKAGSVPLTFVPPPVEQAVYSIGIYEAKSGKLVRRLCEAAGEKAFTVGLNGFITSWDGKDDDGKALPPGRYAARGFAVGPMEVEGLEVLGNDWAADEESLRVLRVTAIICVPDDEGLAAVFRVPDEREWVVARFKGSDGSLLWQKPATTGKVAESGGDEPEVLEVKDGELIMTRGGGERVGYRLSDGETHALPRVAGHNTDKKTSLGKSESVWKIDDDVLSQHSLKGDVSRSLAPSANDPLPLAVAASTKSDRFYLLEEKGDWQRVRGLAWVSAKAENGKPVSTWQTFFERNIRAPDPVLGLEAAALAKEGPAPVEIALRENPLAPGKHPLGEFAAVFDAKGSYLATGDGLRLRLISERRHLRAARLRKEKSGDGLLFYDTDGAAWDGFSIRGAGGVIEFDAGEFEIDAGGEKANTEKVAEPEG